MMNKLVFFSTLVFAHAVASFSSNEDSKLCDSLGFRCSTDCKRVEYCAEYSKDPMVLRTCAQSSFCGIKKGLPQCDLKSCPTALPECPILGTIPSANNCQEYALCSGENLAEADSSVFSCENGYVYDTVQKNCSNHLKCRKPVRCRRAGDNGFVDPDTKQFCYYCKERNSPFVYPCNPDQQNY